jgi:ribose 5-phosphate isomerase A
MLTKEEIKKQLGKYAADLIPANSTIGMGSGTTIFWLISELAARTKEGFNLKIVPASAETKRLAEQAGITTLELNDVTSLPFTIDGADEIDKNFQLIKGGGGALLREKMVAALSEKLIIIADENKCVSQLGRFPLPVEVVPWGWKGVQKKILALGCKKTELRKKNAEPFISADGHYILDCHFEKIIDPVALNASLHLIPGVLETGLFVNMTDTALIGYADGRIDMKVKGSVAP